MKNWFAKITGIKILKDEPLSRHTSFHIGGNAKYFIKIYSIRALRNVLYIIRKNKMRYFIIGAGTNLLINDKGFSGVVLKLYGIFRKMRKRGNIFSCGSGMLINAFSERASKVGYGGAEFLAGIPGTIGGAIKGNAGAFGKSIAGIVETVTVIDRKIIEQNLHNDEIGFAYRASKIKDGVVIISAEIRLTKKRHHNIRSTVERNLKYRWKRQPGGYSAGSFFKNPAPYSAGRLIEECGLKNLRIGDAEVSKKHANFIINRHNAKAADVIKLAKMIKKIVKDKKGVVLQEEVKILN